MDKSPDRLRRASGETEEEISQPSATKAAKDVTPVVTEQVAMDTIMLVETMTVRNLSDAETETWKRKLMTYPYWKLLKTSEYTGGLKDNEFFRWLDILKRPEDPPTYIHSLPEPQSDTAKRTHKFVGIIYSDAEKEVKDKAEKEWVDYMHSRGHTFVRCQREGNR